MSPFTFFVLCLQAFLIQTAYGQVISTGLNNLAGINYNNLALNSGPISTVNTPFGVPDVAAVSSLPVTGPYGGVGTGEIAVAGEVSATGQTIVTGQVPVIGTVQFSGQIPASGVVSIAGNCGCGSVAL